MKKSKFRVRISDVVDDDIDVNGVDSSNHHMAVHRLHVESKKWQRRDDRLIKSRLTEDEVSKRMQVGCG